MAPVERPVDGARRSWGDDVRAVGWWLALAAAAGGTVGLLVGGLGGRLLMLVLRLTSDGVDGVTSDDGFEIGRVSLDSLNLLMFGAAAGVLFAGLYVLLRTGVPARARVPAATVLAGAVGGVAFLDKDGIDLLVLEPTWLAIAGFVALPALAGLLISLAVERGATIPAWSLGRRHLLALIPAVVGFVALPLLLLGGAVAALARHILPLERAAPLARVVVPGFLIFVLVVSALGLIDDIGTVT